MDNRKEENDDKNKKIGNPNESKNPDFDDQVGKRQGTLHSSDMDEIGCETRDRYGTVPGVIAASPPKFVLLEERVMAAQESLKNMALAHQIATDRNFKIENVKFAPNTLGHHVKEMMHQAFWKSLRDQLEEDPPNYKQALGLLEEIRVGLNKLLLPRQQAIKKQINEVLDVEFIKQQAEAKTLDFHKYASYVISMMGKLCAPVRDEAVQNLAQLTDVVDIFKGIVELLELMRIDMVNFTIDVMRPGLIAASVESEKQHFNEFLKTQSDGLAFTRAWLQRNAKPNLKGHEVLTAAFVELLREGDVPLPETVVITDAENIASLNGQCTILSTAATVVLLTLSYLGPNAGNIEEFRKSLKGHVCLILEECKSKEKVNEALDNVADLVVKDVNEFKEKNGSPVLTGEQEEFLKTQIKEVGSNERHRITDIVRRRMFEFLHDTISAQRPAHVQIPPGLTVLQEELTSLAKKFCALVSHNKAVFGEHYDDLLKRIVPTATSNTLRSS